MMYGVQILLLLLAMRTDGYAWNDALCNYILEGCHRDVNNYSMVDYNSSMLNYCGIENIPSKINFTIKLGKSTGYLKVEFKFPEVECRYGVALLVNSSIKDEKECAKHRFEKGDISTKTLHTPEKILCVHRNTNQLVTYNDNSTVSSCEDIIKLWFEHIFTGCYALRFHIGRQKYVITGHIFVNTTYKRTEVMEPQFTCKYNIYSNINSSNELINLTLNTSLPADTGLLLTLMPISNYEGDTQKPCIWNGTPVITSWKINLVNNTMKNCSVNTILTMTGEYAKIVQCNFQIAAVAKATGYCFMFSIFDKRCRKNTFWEPPENANNMTCIWIKRCTRTFASLLHIEKTNVTRSDKLSTSLYLPIVVIVLLLSAIIGTLCFFLSNLHIRNERINLYVNPQQDDFVKPICLKSTDLSVTNNDNEKTIDRNILAYNGIILVYTKSFAPFMALMKDFRETLSKLCSCSVHDWHDGAQWNDVARVGAVLWFTELFNRGCRIIWIDTPATRSIVMSNFKESDYSDSSKLNKYEISGFRDTEFHVVLEMAKRNIKDSMLQYRKHFVVRFTGLESSENLNDPFLDLSPHTRYLMPQHLAQLCSDLSAMDQSSVISTYKMETEEDMLQQHLALMKIESIM